MLSDNMITRPSWIYIFIHKNNYFIHRTNKLIVLKILVGQLKAKTGKDSEMSCLSSLKVRSQSLHGPNMGDE